MPSERFSFGKIGSAVALSVILLFVLAKAGGGSPGAGSSGAENESYERIVSGPGIGDIYDFFRDAKGMPETAKHATLIAAAPDRNAEISRLGILGISAVASRALEVFMSAYGAEAGNLALKILSVGGLYVGGGIAPRILEKLKDGTFMRSFTDKGRLSQLLINMPVRVILESRAALLGAAAYAEARAAELSGVSPRAASVAL